MNTMLHADLYSTHLIRNPRVASVAGQGSEEEQSVGGSTDHHSKCILPAFIGSYV